MEQKYSKEEIAKTLQKIGYLSQIEIDKHPKLPARTAIVRLFKTTKMSDVWKKLGIAVPTTHKSKYTKEEVARTLKKTGWLKYSEIDKHPELPAVMTIRRLFKTTNMSDVWKVLGITIPTNRYKTKYTKEAVAKALKKIGYLTKIEINKHSELPSVSTILRLFNTTKISEVWNQLNIEPVNLSHHKKKPRQ